MTIAATVVNARRQRMMIFAVNRKLEDGGRDLQTLTADIRIISEMPDHRIETLP